MFNPGAIPAQFAFNLRRPFQLFLRRWGQWCGVRFGLLGALLLKDEDGGLVPVDGARLRVLLAALLLQAGTPVSAEMLAEAVWDGAPPPAAARTLRSHVGRLRRVLGPEAVRVVALEPGYLIRVEPAELDVFEFERLCQAAGAALREGAWQPAADAAAEALGLWRGQPLLDIPSQVLRDGVVPRLERLRVQALENRAEAGLRLGQHERLLPELHEMVTAHPLRERSRGQLMLALYRSGRPAEALVAYQDARKVLVEELGIEPGPELRRLHERMLAGDGDLVVLRPLTGPVPEDAAVGPRQLPAAARHFAGRRPELDLITGLISPSRQADSPGGTVVISAIDGMAGIGKTALAIHAAHQLAEMFPDGQLFIDLHGYTQGQRPRTAGEALAWLLRALGVPPGQIPKEREQAAALYRHRLSGTRTLIVLDNAATEAQVRPLLPGTGSCLVLVTSRRRLKALDDARTLSLDVLPAPDAVALLRVVAGIGHDAADDRVLGEVAELCGYLPLALRIAASLRRHRPSWPLEHLAGLLREQHLRVQALSDGERDLSAAFDLSYASLDEQHRLLWRRLGVIPGPDLDAYAAAALSGLDPVTAARRLQDLVDHNLLTEHAPGRYRLHDLLRAHARTLAATEPAPEREAAVERLLHYYAHTAQRASVPIARYPRPQPDGPGPAHTPALADSEAARTWLRTEHPNLEGAFTHAHRHGPGRHAIALAAGLAEILQTDGPFSRALEIHQTAAEIADSLDDRAAHANALTDLGRVQQVTGNDAGASNALTAALEIYRALGHRHGEGAALTALGRVRCLTGDYPGAVDALIRALEIYRALGNRHGEAGALNDLGRVRCQTGDYPGAVDALTQALEIYRALGHRHGEASPLTHLGHVRCLTGDYPGALDALTQALEIYRALGNRLGGAGALNDLGNARCLTGDFSGALDALTRALEIYRGLGHRHGEGVALTDLGRVRYLTADFSGALGALTRALEIFRALGNHSNEAWSLNYYAAALAATGQRPRALALYQQALAMNRELNKPDDEAISLEGIAEHHLATGDPAQGTAHLQQALEIYRRLGMAPDTLRAQNRLDSLAPA
jgi:DNA-binding SARP family transcriptional activator/tetratricopeptide (TPR) repeat protein